MNDEVRRWDSTHICKTNGENAKEAGMKTADAIGFEKRLKREEDGLLEVVVEGKMLLLLVGI